MNSTTYGVDEYGNDAGLVSSGYVGEIKMFGFSGVPAHCLACDGSLISIAAYPELYAKLGTLYGGDGVTTFALPTAEDVIYAAGNGRAVGAAVADGLPNIKAIAPIRGGASSSGDVKLVYNNQMPFDNSGALYLALHENSFYTIPVGSLDNGQHVDAIQLDLSRGNSIYGASSHVQPKGTAFNVCIVYE